MTLFGIIVLVLVGALALAAGPVGLALLVLLAPAIVMFVLLPKHSHPHDNPHFAAPSRKVPPR